MHYTFESKCIYPFVQWISFVMALSNIVSSICRCRSVYAYFPRSNIRWDYYLYCSQHLRWYQQTLHVYIPYVSEKQSMCMYLWVNVLPRRFYSVPVPIMDGVMGIFDPPHTGTHVPEEIHLPLTHLQGQEINLRHTEDICGINCT